jgi:hypothetical protein
VSTGNWGWRYSKDALNRELADKLAAIVQVTDREPFLTSETREQR